MEEEASADPPTPLGGGVVGVLGGLGMVSSGEGDRVGGGGGHQFGIDFVLDFVIYGFGLVRCYV